jgi:hypothetical protein
VAARLPNERKTRTCGVAEIDPAQIELYKNCGWGDNREFGSDRAKEFFAAPCPKPLVGRAALGGDLKPRGFSR